jgi:transposase InsO family protein
LVFDDAKYFSSLKIVEFALKYNINIKYSAIYYSQGNGVVESTNKNLLWIIKKTIVKNQRDWHTALDTALWVDTVTPRNSLGTSPYFLVYGKEAILPPNIYLPSLQLSHSSRGQSSNFLQT